MKQLEFDLVAMITTVMVVILFYFGYRYRKQKINPMLKAVLITGCDSGFGQLLAIRLDSEGYKVFAGCLDANSEGAKILQTSASSTLQVLQLDVTKDDQIETIKVLLTETLERYSLWAIVNNAGVARHAQFEWLPKSAFDKMIQVNLMGMVNVTRTFLPLLRASKGRIINMASMAGRTAIPGFTAYSASKFAVIGFSDSLRREMTPFYVKVITVEPSLYRTGIASKDNFLLQNDVFWSTADPAIRRDYGETFFNSAQISRMKLLMWTRSNLNEVVDSCAHAISAVHPYSRYVTPHHLRIMNDIMNVLHTAIQDFIIYHITALKSIPDMMYQQSQDLTHFKLGRRRSHAT